MAAFGSLANNKSDDSQKNSRYSFTEFVELDDQEKYSFWNSLSRDDKKEWILAISDLDTLKGNKLGRQVYVQYVVNLLRYGYNSTQKDIVAASGGNPSQGMISLLCHSRYTSVPSIQM